MHTLKLLLRTTAEDDAFLASVFLAITKVHNKIVCEGKKRLRMLRRDKRYRYAKSHYGTTKEQCDKLENKIAALEKKLTASEDKSERRVLRKQRADAELKHPDRKACIRDFPAFLKMQDALILRMKSEGISMKHCFGF